MSMINCVDNSPDTPVINAAAERMALKEIEHEEFRDTNEMAGFQRGYSRGFLEGAEFMRAFYRNRDTRDHLARIERDRRKREAEKNKGIDDSNLLHPVNHSPKQEDPIPPMGGFHD